MTLPSADHFDRWYAAMTEAPDRDALVHDALGLPPEVASTSVLPGTGLDEVVQLLGLRAGDLLVDLACGRGGYGMEIARRTGARVVGVDFSEVAVELARDRVALFGLEGRAEFRCGDLTATGLPPGQAHAVVCVDGVQFAPSATDAAREVARLLRPGGRAVLTSWQGDDERLPQRIRELDLDAALAAAGFAEVRVEERPQWAAQERRMWERAVASTAQDEASAALREEARRVLAAAGAQVRVVASATRPR